MLRLLDSGTKPVLKRLVRSSAVLMKWAPIGGPALHGRCFSIGLGVALEDRDAEIVAERTAIGEVLYRGQQRHKGSVCRLVIGLLQGSHEAVHSELFF